MHIIRYMLSINIFGKMNRAIRMKVLTQEPGLYISLLFPIGVTFLLTFVAARIISHLYPDLYIPWSGGLHVHHFAYGFFILTASGYLALVFSDPRAKYLISLLHGFGLGLAFDEFAIWLKLQDDDPVRFNYDGFMIVVGSILILISAKKGLQMARKHWPFRIGPRP